MRHGKAAWRNCIVIACACETISVIVLLIVGIVLFSTEKPIFSIDVHQECLKFATGGQGVDSGRVVIWNLLPVLSEKAEMDESVPKMLCQMDNHLACVNCVRWSQNGLLLASCSDDKLVMIWKQLKVLFEIIM